MSYKCQNCGKELDLGINAQVSRNDDCPDCGYDLHICLNCKFYDLNSYNECRENQAERVLDKDKANFCDYFKFSEKINAKKKVSKNDSLNKLNDIFKK